jgi:hypothetical protein
VIGDLVFPKFGGEELGDDVVEASFDVEEEGRGFHAGLL